MEAMHSTPYGHPAIANEMHLTRRMARRFSVKGLGMGIL